MLRRIMTAYQSKLGSIRIQKGTLKAHFAVLMSATVVSQLLLFGSSPFLTRLYSPDDFGIFGLVTAFTSVAAIFVTGRYELAIMLPNNFRDAFYVLVLASGLTVFGSLLCLIILVCIPAGYLIKLGMEHIGGLLYAMPVLMMVQSIYQILYYWLNRQRKYPSMAKTRLWVVLLATFAAIGIGYNNIISGGLVISQIIAYAFVDLIIICQMRNEIKSFMANIKVEEILKQGKRYSDFPRYLVVADSMECLSANLPIILLNSFLGSVIAGQFALTQRVMAAPVSFVAKTMGDIIRERFSCAYRETGNCEHAFTKSLKLLAYIAIFPALIFGLFGPDIFRLVFGSIWEEAGVYSRLLVSMIFLQMISNPLSVMYMVAEKQKAEFYLQIARLSLCYIALVGGFYFTGKAEFSVFGFGLSMSFIYIFMIYQCRVWSRDKTRIIKTEE